MDGIVSILAQFFSYSTLEPLLFTRVEFWIFFALVWLAYLWFHNRLNSRSLFLLAVSLLFYYKSSGLFFFLILLSIAFNYGMALWIESRGRRAWRKSLLCFTVAMNLLLLCYCKYTGFFIEGYNALFGAGLTFNGPLTGVLMGLLGVDIDVAKSLVLPVGISFFTFQALSYVVDVYRGDIKALRNPIDFGFYLSFFPQLVAGPIVRASDFIPLIHAPYSLSVREAGHALYLIIIGLIKKCILSDFIALNLVDRVFANPAAYSGVENLLSVYGYTLQIYCDFSGYTDIAIGLALLLGFHLPINFNRPYRAVSITDFWRRWHISLSTWLRDYLYIPLGGNRHGKWMRNVNLMLTMLLGGLWHGASWTFVAWGGAHGLGLILSKLVDRLPGPLLSNSFFRFCRAVVVFHIVASLWVFFRAGSFTEAIEIFQRVFSGVGFAHMGSIVVSYGHVCCLMLVGYTLQWIPTPWLERMRGAFIGSPVVVKFILTLMAVLVVLYYQSAGLQPFIYFAF